MCGLSRALFLVILFVPALAGAVAIPENARTPEELIDLVLDHVEHVDSEESRDALDLLFKRTRTRTSAGLNVTVHHPWVRVLRPFAHNRSATFPTILVNPHARILSVFVNPIEGSEWMRTIYLTSARLIDTRTGERLQMQIECREIRNLFGQVMPKLSACTLATLDRVS